MSNEGAKTVTKPRRDGDELEPLCLTPLQAARLLAIGKSKLYELIKEGLPFVLIGEDMKIPLIALRRWIDERTQAMPSAL
jgi:excisionase family DNA binding protein